MFVKMIYASKSCVKAVKGNIWGRRMNMIAHLLDWSKANGRRRFSGLVRGTSMWNAPHMHITMVLKQIERMPQVPLVWPPGIQWAISHWMLVKMVELVIRMGRIKLKPHIHEMVGGYITTPSDRILRSTGSISEPLWKKSRSVFEATGFRLSSQKEWYRGFLWPYTCPRNWDTDDGFLNSELHPSGDQIV